MAQAGALVARVLQVKRNGKKTFVITDAAMNDLIRPALYQAHHEIVPVKPARGQDARVVDVVGPVCESGDFFARDRKLPPLEPGDLVALLDAGAYGMAQSSNYNTRLRPPRFWSKAQRRASSAAARPWPTCWRRRWREPFFESSSVRNCDDSNAVAESLIRGQAIKIAEFLNDPVRAVLILLPK